MPRLFTGLEIPQSVAQSLAMMRGGLPGARWIDAENYHLTLRFIGDIDDALAREIAGVLARVHRRPFELRLDGLTSFGGRKPRAVVATATPVRAADGAAGRARSAAATARARAGGTQIHAACHAGAVARFIEPSGCRLPRRSRALSLDAVSGVALCAVFLTRLGRRRALYRRGGLSAHPARRGWARSENDDLIFRTR